MEPDLRVHIGGIEMKNPVTVASGTFGYGPEYAELVDLNALGAMVVKGISLEPTKGNKTPRTHEVPSGLINSIGLQNPGVEGFCKTYLPFLRQYDVPVIVNIWGTSVEEYAEVARQLSDVDGIAGLEINVSCPNVKAGGHTFSVCLDSFRTVLDAVRDASHLPLMPKLAPNVPDIASYAKAAESCGMDAVSLINTLPAMAIDVETRKPILGNTVGGLSGPAIHHVAVKAVWDVARSVNLPVIGMGGIYNDVTALEMMIAGASAVAVGTANFSDPHTVYHVLDGIRAYLKRHQVDHVADLVGTVEL